MQAVFFNGPESYSGLPPNCDEVPRWTVHVGDEEGQPVEGGGKVVVFSHYESAEDYAWDLSEKMGLELVDEAMPL